MAETLFERAAYEARLTTRSLGRTLIARAEVASTNDVAWDALGEGLPDGTAVVADAQTRGRGRAGRDWHTGPGKGLALSVLLQSGCDRRPLGLLPLAAGLALARGLERLGARAELKWPNDLLLAGRKLAGVLCESRGVRGAEAAVIGAGVNVAHAPEDFPPALAAVATSLAMEGCVTTREAVAAEFLNALEPLWNELREGDPMAVLGAWRSRAGFWGRAVRVRTPGGPVDGIARALDDDGALVIEDASGATITVLAGDLDIAGASVREGA